MSKALVKKLQGALRVLQSTPAPCPAIASIELVDDSLFLWDVVLHVTTTDSAQEAVLEVHVRLEFPQSPGPGLPTVGVLRPRLAGQNIFDGAVCLQEFDMLAAPSTAGGCWLDEPERVAAFFHVLTERLTPPNVTVSDAAGAYSEEERRGGERRIVAAHPTRDVASNNAAVVEGAQGAPPPGTEAGGDDASAAAAVVVVRMSALAEALDAIDREGMTSGIRTRHDIIVELDDDEEEEDEDGLGVASFALPPLLQIRGNVGVTVRSAGERGTAFGHVKGSVLVVAGSDASLVLRGVALRGLIVVTDGGTCTCEHASVAFNHAATHNVDDREAIVASCDTLVRSQRTFAAVTVVGQGSHFAATASSFTIVHDEAGAQYMPRDAACFVAAGARLEASCECSFTAALATGIYVDAATAVVSDAAFDAVRGVFAFDGATAHLSDVLIRATPVSPSSHRTHGVWVETLSHVEAERVVVDGADTGFLSIVASTISTTDCRVVEGENGFVADGARIIVADGCVVDACVCPFVGKNQAMLIMTGSDYDIDVSDEEVPAVPHDGAIAQTPVISSPGRGCVRQLRGVHAITVESGSIGRFRGIVMDLADRRAVPVSNADRTTIGVLCTGVGSRCELEDCVVRGPCCVTATAPPADAATTWSVGVKAQLGATVNIQGAACALSSWYEACMAITNSRLVVTNGCVVRNSYIGVTIASSSQCEISGHVALVDIRQSAVFLNAGDGVQDAASLEATDAFVAAGAGFGIEAVGATARLSLARVVVVAPSQAEERPTLVSVQGGGRADVDESVFGAAGALRRLASSQDAAVEKAASMVRSMVAALSLEADATAGDSTPAQAARRQAWERSASAAEDRCVGLSVGGAGAVVKLSSVAAAGCNFGIAAASKASLRATNVVAAFCTNAFTFAHELLEGTLRDCTGFESRQVGLYVHAGSTAAVERCCFDVVAGAFGVEVADPGTSVTLSDSVIRLVSAPDAAAAEAFRAKVGVFSRDGAKMRISATFVGSPREVEEDEEGAPFTLDTLGVVAFKAQSKATMALENCSARRVVAGLCVVSEASVVVTGDAGFAATDVGDGVKVVSGSSAEFDGPVAIAGRCGHGIIVVDTSECVLKRDCTVSAFVHSALVVSKGAILRFSGRLHVAVPSVAATPIGDNGAVAMLVDDAGAVIGVHPTSALILDLKATPRCQGLKAQQGGQVQLQTVTVIGADFAVAALGENTRIRCEVLTIDGCSNGITVDGGGDVAVAKASIASATSVGAFVPRGRLELRCARIESPRHALECGGPGAVLHAAGQFRGEIVAGDGGELNVRQFL